MTSTLASKSEIDCEIPATMARKQPSQPPQPSKAKASKGRNGKQQALRALQPPQPSLTEAKAEVSQGNQPKPPQPPLGNALNQDKSKSKRRRRRGQKGKKPYRTAPNVAPSSSKHLRDSEKCEQAEVNRSKRLRVDSPPVASQLSGRNDKDNLKEIVPLKPIKPKALPLRRSYTSFFPKQFNLKRTSQTSRPQSSKSLRSKQEPSSASIKEAYRLQRSKTFRANLKTKRDFSHTLKSLAECLNSDTDSAYSSISRVESIPTSGQSTSEDSIKSISDIDLFGFRAKPSSSIPPTLSTWSLSSSSASESDDVA